MASVIIPAQGHFDAHMRSADTRSCKVLSLARSFICFYNKGSTRVHVHIISSYPNQTQEESTTVECCCDRASRAEAAYWLQKAFSTSAVTVLPMEHTWTTASMQCSRKHQQETAPQLLALRFRARTNQTRSRRFKQL